MIRRTQLWDKGNINYEVTRYSDFNLKFYFTQEEKNVAKKK